MYTERIANYGAMRLPMYLGWSAAPASVTVPLRMKDLTLEHPSSQLDGILGL